MATPASAAATPIETVSITAGNQHRRLIVRRRGNAEDKTEDGDCSIFHAKDHLTRQTHSAKP
jgi:hypothetical protein